MQNISLQSSGMHRKQNFQIVFGFKSETAVTDLYFSNSLLPSFLAFLASFFFLLLGIIIVGFILLGKVFRKALRILGLNKRKGRWVVEQDFHGKFQVNVT